MEYLQLSKMAETSRTSRLTGPQLEILKVLWAHSEGTVVEIHQALSAREPITTL
jgi:predicted transcriptional regulator